MNDVLRKPHPLQRPAAIVQCELADVLKANHEY